MVLHTFPIDYYTIISTIYIPKDQYIGQFVLDKLFVLYGQIFNYPETKVCLKAKSRPWIQISYFGVHFEDWLLSSNLGYSLLLYFSFTIYIIVHIS